MEDIIFKCVMSIGAPVFRIQEREPVHPHNRMQCKKLNWTMSHDLNENIKTLNEYKPKR